MVANAFGVTGSNKTKYSALFPPSDGGSYYPSPPLVVGTSLPLTRSWRVVESVKNTDAYLAVQYFDTTTNTWVTVHCFNTSPPT